MRTSHYPASLALMAVFQAHAAPEIMEVQFGGKANSIGQVKVRANGVCGTSPILKGVIE